MAARQVTISATGKTLLGGSGDEAVGRLLVHIPSGATISMTFVGRPAHPPKGTALSASDDVTLGYYTTTDDTLASAAYSTSPGQVSVKCDGNLVYANVASVTGSVVLTVVPLQG